MAKRFIDTELFLNPSLRVTPTLYKLFWIGLITRCDHAGIWPVDWEMISLLCGGNIEKKKVIELFSDDLIFIKDGQFIFFHKFIEYQYPKGLKPNVAAQKSVIERLKKFSLWDEKKQTVNITLTPTLSKGLQDKDKDKDKDNKSDEKLKIDLPWNSDTFLKAWLNWKTYKKNEHKFSYKTKATVNAALEKLKKLSNGNESEAIEIINESIANGWKGFFARKPDGGSHTRGYDTDPFKFDPSKMDYSKGFND